MRHTFLFHAVGLSLLAAAPVQAVPVLTDPTRPAAFKRPASSPAARGVGDAGAVPAPVMPSLQSLQVFARGGSSALVDGRVVRVGDRLGETLVVTIDAQGILLRGPRYEQRIALVPGGGKTASLAANTAASAGHASRLPASLTTRPVPGVIVVQMETQ